MSREIKFRGKRIDSDEWVYGYLYFGFNCTDEYVPFISWKDSSYLGGIGEEEINIKTIGQYTELHDKNGKEIYEGNIVKVNNEIIAKVIWDNDYLGYFLYANEENSIDSFENGEQPLYDYLDSIEVIGNIYDNPELLGGD